MEYYIFVTNDCNLNCKYCSVLLSLSQSKIPKEPTYSIDTLNKFIDETQKKYNDKIADIIFFGGEPTLNYNFIEKIIKKHKLIKFIPYKFHYMLHTNGILLDNIPNYILQNIDLIMLSINYDKIPHSNLYQSYFQKIASSIKKIKKISPIPIIARFTITEETSLYSEISLLNPFFDAIYWQIENCYEFKNYNTFFASYKYELEITFDLWLKYLKRGILLQFIPFIAAYCFINIPLSDSFCCGYNDSMVYVQTDGTCFTCAEDMTTEKNLVGNINYGIKFDNFTLKSTKCASCEYLYMCRGRCGRMHREFTSEHIEEYCNLNKLLFDLIKTHYQEIYEACKNHNLNLNTNEQFYHYTEYTP